MLLNLDYHRLLSTILTLETRRILIKPIWNTLYAA